MAITESQRAAKRKYRQLHASKVREYNRRYTAENREKVRLWAQVWEAMNKEQRDAYRLLHKGRIKQDQARSRGNRRDQILETNSRYRARAKKATPKWADRELMADIYRLARIHREAGIDCHVDHVVPLKGKLVSGLHSHHNLSVILASTNVRKRATWVP